MPSALSHRIASQPPNDGQEVEMDVLSRGVSTDPSPLRARPPKPLQSYAVGIGLLLCVVCLWTASNFITQDLFEDGFDKPFFVTYTNTSAFTLYLLPFAVKQAWTLRRGARTSGAYQPLPSDAEGSDDAVKPHNSASALPPLTLKETAQLAVVFCFFWFIANWTINAALGETSVASATILSSMSGFFTLGLGRLLGVERLTPVKIWTVLISFLGVVLVSWSDSTQPLPSGSPEAPATRHPILGDMLALVSALFYAIYVILLKIRIKDESRIDMATFFGFVGLFNIPLMWPVGAVLHFTGIEPFELPRTSIVWIPILINMVITWSSDYLYVLAMLKTTPLVVTVGLSLTIPFAVFGDFMKGRTSEFQVVFGAILVVVSFIALGFAENRDVPEEATPFASPP